MTEHTESQENKATTQPVEASAVERLVMPFGSGILDKNCTEIHAGDLVEFIIYIKYQQPVVRRKMVVWYRGAFRFKNERENCQSCIGDISHNCTLEVLKD